MVSGMVQVSVWLIYISQYLTVVTVVYMICGYVWIIEEWIFNELEVEVEKSEYREPSNCIMVFRQLKSNLVVQ